MLVHTFTDKLVILIQWESESVVFFFFLAHFMVLVSPIQEVTRPEPPLLLRLESQGIRGGMVIDFCFLVH